MDILSGAAVNDVIYHYHPYPETSLRQSGIRQQNAALAFSICLMTYETRKSKIMSINDLVLFSILEVNVKY